MALVENNVTAGHQTSDVEIALVDLKRNPSDELLRKNGFAWPVMFERSASTWWNPKFCDDDLEKVHKYCLFPQTRMRFRWALLYVIVSCLFWCVFFGVVQDAHWVVFLVGTLVLLIVILAVFGITCMNAFKGIHLPVSICFILLLCVADLLSFLYEDPDFSSVGTFIGSLEILLVLYVLMPMPLCMCVGIGVLYSLAFELLSGFMTEMKTPAYILSRALLHVAVHVIGIYMYIMLQVRNRSTFLKVCRSVRLRRDLEAERQLKRCMINSLMPPKVAEEIMKSRDHDRDRGDSADEEADDRTKRRRSSQGPERGRMLFRHFHMSQMDKVSILFADIVGFTKMSSKKTAKHLVFLLSDLFGRFDKICVECHCEKISTLGDCYYCVSGCPEPREDHAKCCVEMGLKMCVAIKQFDSDHNEEVNMRVGVHTGTVLCGLVGTRRFKFDVWSHDVTLANMMESEGKAGLVHISDCTYNFVKDDYEVEKGKTVPDIRTHRLLTECFDSKTQQFIVQHVETTGTIGTWFIKGRKSEASQTSATAAQNGATPINDTPGKSSDGTLPSETFICVDGTSTSAANEEPKELEQTNVPSVQLIGRRENSLHEEIDGEANSNGAAVAHLLGSKKQDDHVGEQLRKMITAQAENYLYHPAINHWTVSFRNSKVEHQYHQHFTKDIASGHLEFVLPHFNSLLDMIVVLIFFSIISVCCFVAFEVRFPLVIVFVVAMVLELLLLVLMWLNVFKVKQNGKGLEKLLTFLAGWYPRHLMAGFTACFPTLAVFSTFLCDLFDSGSPKTDLFYCLLVIGSLVNFCNFTLLSSWMKTSLAMIASLILFILLGTEFCGDYPTYGCESENSTSCLAEKGVNATGASEILKPLFWSRQPLMYEVIIVTVLLLLLLFFINREIEISYRVCFHGDIEAARDKEKMRTEEEQANWLLHNIVPQHVAEHLKLNNSYSKTHKDIGVIFAKIVNFEDFYDESFEGGKEYLRVLNELMGDFEELFDDPEYRDIEKIKTIGSCLMAASGLNPQSANDDPNAHLCALMNFSYDLLHKLEQFNKEIFNFDFEMSIGYNFGEVTAGVVGTTKLLYDIWGDTVNIASRMYSTGVHGRIQVTEYTAVRLKDYFDFEPRGKVFVKGKGDMNVFLLAEKRRQDRRP